MRLVLLQTLEPRCKAGAAQADPLELERPSIKQQIASGKLVCPVTGQRLELLEKMVRSADGALNYPIVNGSPILLANTNLQKEYLARQDGAMEQEYRNLTRLRIRTWLTARLARDYRSSAASAAFEEVVAKQDNGALCVSIGGGPTRSHPKLVNLNIGLFPNVDVVGDAYCLPYAQGSVDAVCCEAVLEHLEFPDRAASEMYRVLKPGGQVFSATPFLQLFHAYPDHYQNFTLEGHRRLFERADFKVTASGVCVGPTVAMAILLSNYVKVFAPFRALGLIASILVRVPALVLTPLDLYLNRHPQAHVLASTTFVHAVKVDA